MSLFSPQDIRGEVVVAKGNLENDVVKADTSENVADAEKAKDASDENDRGKQ